MTRRRARPGSHRLAVVVVVILLAGAAAQALVHLLPVLLLLAAVFTAGWCIRARRAVVDEHERNQLAADLDDARASAAAAWDAAASVPPRPVTSLDDRRARLLDDPRSGARPLGGSE